MYYKDIVQEEEGNEEITREHQLQALIEAERRIRTRVIKEESKSQTPEVLLSSIKRSDIEDFVANMANFILGGRAK
jgi:hypothetical protein